MPQLNPEFFISQLFWLVVTFSFLLVFLWRISLPRISSVLIKREKKINDDIALAKELQGEANNIQKIVDGQIKQTYSKTSEIIKETNINLQKKIINEIEKIDNELDNKINESSKIIEKNKKESLKEINHQIHDITRMTVAKISNFDLTNKEIEEAIETINNKLN